MTLRYGNKARQGKVKIDIAALIAAEQRKADGEKRDPMHGRTVHAADLYAVIHVPGGTDPDVSVTRDLDAAVITSERPWRGGQFPAFVLPLDRAEVLHVNNTARVFGFTATAA